MGGDLKMKITPKDVLAVAKGCHDYNGGHSGKESRAFHGGIDTVVNCLESLFSKGPTSHQLKVVHGIGLADIKKIM